MKAHFISVRQCYVIYTLLLLTVYIEPAKAQITVDAEECTRQFFGAITEKKVMELSNILASDFTVIGMDGQIIDRETFISSIENGYISVQTGILDGIRLKEYMEVGVVSGRWNLQANIANTRYFGDVTFLSICVKKGGSWKVSTIQFTPIM